MISEPESLDRERSHAEVAAGLEELRAPENVDALAVGQVEPECVETAASDRYAETSTVARVLQREEDRLPAWIPAELRDLALDPHRGQPLQPLGDPAVERADGVDLSFPILDRLDLRHRGVSMPRGVRRKCL